MPTPASYSATERMRDGSVVEIRALRPDDKDDMLAAVGRAGMQSLQRRFFVVKRGFSEKEIAFFMNIDFTNHVALVAFANEDNRKIIIGGGRYIVTEPGTAEIAFVVIDPLSSTTCPALVATVPRIRTLSPFPFRVRPSLGWASSPSPTARCSARTSPGSATASSRTWCWTAGGWWWPTPG